MPSEIIINNYILNLHKVRLFTIYIIIILPYAMPVMFSMCFVYFKSPQQCRLCVYRKTLWLWKERESINWHMEGQQVSAIQPVSDVSLQRLFVFFRYICSRFFPFSWYHRIRFVSHWQMLFSSIDLQTF